MSDRDRHLGEPQPARGIDSVEQAEARIERIRQNLAVEEPPYLNGPEDEAWWRCRIDFAWLLAERDVEKERAGAAERRAEEAENNARAWEVRAINRRHDV